MDDVWTAASAADYICTTRNFNRGWLDDALEFLQENGKTDVLSRFIKAKLSSKLDVASRSGSERKLLIVPDGWSKSQASKLAQIICQIPVSGLIYGQALLDDPFTEVTPTLADAFAVMFASNSPEDLQAKMYDRHSMIPRLVDCVLMDVDLHSVAEVPHAQGLTNLVQLCILVSDGGSLLQVWSSLDSSLGKVDNLLVRDIRRCSDLSREVKNALNNVAALLKESRRVDTDRKAWTWDQVQAWYPTEYATMTRSKVSDHWSAMMDYSVSLPQSKRPHWNVTLRKLSGDQIALNVDATTKVSELIAAAAPPYQDVKFMGDRELQNVFGDARCTEVGIGPVVEVNILRIMVPDASRTAARAVDFVCACNIKRVWLDDALEFLKEYGKADVLSLFGASLSRKLVVKRKLLIVPDGWSKSQASKLAQIICQIPVSGLIYGQALLDDPFTEVTPTLADAFAVMFASNSPEDLQAKMYDRHSMIPCLVDCVLMDVDLHSVAEVPNAQGLTNLVQLCILVSDGESLLQVWSSLDLSLGKVDNVIVSDVCLCSDLSREVENARNNVAASLKESRRADTDTPCKAWTLAQDQARHRTDFPRMTTSQVSDHWSSMTDYSVSWPQSKRHRRSTGVSQEVLAPSVGPSAATQAPQDAVEDAVEEAVDDAAMPLLSADALTEEEFRRSNGNALQREQADLQQALLQSKVYGPPPVSTEDVVIFRLTRYTQEIREALATSSALKDVRARIEDAGCETTHLPS